MPATIARTAPRPAGALPQAPAGFRVGLFADGLSEPRVIRTAPNGDVFVAETQAGQVRAFRDVAADGKARENSNDDGKQEKEPVFA